MVNQLLLMDQEHFSGVFFNKMPLLYRDLITFIISFISLLVNIIPEPVVVVTFLSSSFISPFTKFFVEF